jgi:hypothetical protein
MSNFSPNFIFKICQKFNTSHPKVSSRHLLGDFCLANFKFLTDFNLKLGEKLAIKLLTDGT